MLPCILFEDEHLLVVNKPAGINTHAPSPWSGEGIYDWLRDREPRWASLAIIHRLDKDTSGLLVFGLSLKANRSLTSQFSGRQVRKRYLLLTDRFPHKIPACYESSIQRVGDRYIARPPHVGGDLAQTEFRLGPIRTFGQTLPRGTQLIEASPLTGRTHQIRVHAAACGFPVLGDTLYGGTAAQRVFLHAAELEFRHPLTEESLRFQAPFEPQADPTTALRELMIDSKSNTAYRIINGAADGWPEIYVDKLGEYLLVQSPRSLDTNESAMLRRLQEQYRLVSIYYRLLTRHARGRGSEASPSLIAGSVAPPRFAVLENGIKYELSLQEGYSVGLFLDQRENRRRLLTGHVSARFDLPSCAGRAPLELLNTFAYTCGFSVAAAKGGVRTTSLDLSKKYLEWGKSNLLQNGVAPSDHEFIFGDVFEWLNRLHRKGRTFDIIILDPPTFSQSRGSGVFRAEADYGRLVRTAVALLRNPGVLLASTNAAKWEPEAFVETVKAAASASNRRITKEKYAPQPLDFPISRTEPGYLKTLWLNLEA